MTAATAAGFGCTFALAAAVTGVFAASSFVSVSLFRAAGRPEKRSLLSSIMSKVQKRVSEFRHANHYANSVNHNAKCGSRPIEPGFAWASAAHPMPRLCQGFATGGLRCRPCDGKSRSHE
ncbi:exported hypothetical protein [Agrobacterium deltaense RV3]|nr:exported hypothetical protein [Agrobacterium deltaense RV3]